METDPAAAEQSPESADWATSWRAKDKIVFSTTLPEVWTERTRLERKLAPDVVAAAKRASAGDLTVEGPTLAAEALRLDLSLRRERRFDNGMVQVTYDVAGH